MTVPSSNTLKPKVFGHARVEHAKAVEEVALPHPLDPGALADVATGGGIVAVAVHDEHGGFLERRDVEHGCVGVVVGNLDDLRHLAVAVALAEAHPETKREIDDRGGLHAVRAPAGAG